MQPEQNTTPSPEASSQPVPLQPPSQPEAPQQQSVPNPSQIYPDPISQPAWQPIPPAPQQAYSQTPSANMPNQQQNVPANQANAMTVIFQWLTYAFWGWLVLALSVLTANVLSDLIADTNGGSFTPYGVAAVLVLLPIAFICDMYYSKKEPIKKVGGEMIVMVIHAVIFALFAIGSLITAVVTLVQYLTGDANSKTTPVVLLCAVIIFVFYVLAFLRTLSPPAFPWIRKVYRLIMLVLVGVITILGFLGPVAKQSRTRTDRLITNNLSTVSTGINNYARKNDKLPAALSDVSLNGDAKKLVDSNLVEYKPGGVHKSSTSKYGYSSTSSKAEYDYQLCVVFKEESDRKYDFYTSRNDDYTYSSPSTYYHDAGETCYKLKTTSY